MSRKHERHAEGERQAAEATRGVQPPSEGSAEAATATTEALMRERDELQDKLLRAQAECANIAKRMQQQHELALRHAGMGLARDCLPVLDNLDRTVEAVAPDKRQDAFVQGVSLVREEFRKALREHGVVPIEAVGKPFDPTRHEALMRDTNSDLPPNTVTMEYQRGYMMHDRVLRPAKVVVSARSSTDGDGDAAALKENASSPADQKGRPA